MIPEISPFVADVWLFDAGHEIDTDPYKTKGVNTIAARSQHK